MICFHLLNCVPFHKKMFVWCMAHNSLQFKMNVARRGMKLDAQSVWRFNQDPGISSSNVKRQDTVRG